MKRPFNISKRLTEEEPPLRVEVYNTYTGEFLWSFRDGANTNQIGDSRKLQEKAVEMLEKALTLAKDELDAMPEEEEIYDGLD